MAYIELLVVVMFFNTAKGFHQACFLYLEFIILWIRMHGDCNALIIYYGNTRKAMIICFSHIILDQPSVLS